jgi:integrase
MLRLYRRKNVLWLRGSVAGNRIHRSTRTADKAIAEQIRTATEAREWQRRLYGTEAVLTFAQAVTRYLDAGKPERFLAPLVAHFRDDPVKDIKPGTIAQAATKLYPLAGPATRNRQAIAPAQAVINHAAAAGLCPFIRVPRFKVQKTIKPYAEISWIDAFVAAASPRLAALAWFMFLTGARISTATGLRWEDVDLGRGVVVLRKPKGQDDERSHLPPALVVALANIPGERAPRQRVFGYGSRSSVYGPWATACKRAGVLYIPPHRAGRHGFATGLLRESVDPVTVAKLGHWKTPRHVYDTYGHPLEDRTLTEKLLKGRT